MSWENAMKFKLIHLVDGRPGEEFVFESAAPIVLGRDNPDVHVQINDGWVSRLQCMIFEDHGTLRVRDLGSRHGTYINEVQIQDAPLKAGDRLAVGVTSFQLQYPVASERQTAPARSAATTGR
jgi:pSer/pThr/pTyr-binding forkhead associated (FHA) protein